MPGTIREAITDLAKAIGMQPVVSTDKLLVIGDEEFCKWWRDEDDSSSQCGVSVVVTFGECGDVAAAHKVADGTPLGDVTGTYGNAGQRLLWTMHLISQRGLPRREKKIGEEE